MLNDQFSIYYLKGALAAAQLNIERNEKRRKRVIDNLRKLAAKEEKLKEESTKQKFNLKLIQEALVIAHFDIGGAIENLRNLILSTENRAKSKDITVAQKEILNEEIERMKARFQEICSHSFVFERGNECGYSYEGFQCGEGLRCCVICNLQDQGFKKDFTHGPYNTIHEVDTFKVITLNASRVFRSYYVLQGQKIGRDFYQTPLVKLVKDFFLDKRVFELLKPAQK